MTDLAELFTTHGKNAKELTVRAQKKAAVEETAGTEF
jgi:hypothetical protein